MEPIIETRELTRSFADLVAEMVASDLEIAKRDKLVSKQGYQIYGQHE